MITWQCKSFAELSNTELYKILQLRNEVFVVEQKAIYQDCDNKDLKSYHVTAWKDDILVAYSRILPLGIPYPGAASIGRVATSHIVRGQNVGRQLVSGSLDNLYRLFGSVPVIISAQIYLVKFYQGFSFKERGNVYVEDGIQHIIMERFI